MRDILEAALQGVVTNSRVSTQRGVAKSDASSVVVLPDIASATRSSGGDSAIHADGTGFTVHGKVEPAS